MYIIDNNKPLDTKKATENNWKNIYLINKQTVTITNKFEHFSNDIDTRDGYMSKNSKKLLYSDNLLKNNEI